MLACAVRSVDPASDGSDSDALSPMEGGPWGERDEKNPAASQLAPDVPPSKYEQSYAVHVHDSLDLAVSVALGIATVRVFCNPLAILFTVFRNLFVRFTPFAQSFSPDLETDAPSLMSLNRLVSAQVSVSGLKVVHIKSGCVDMVLSCHSGSGRSSNNPSAVWE